MKKPLMVYFVKDLPNFFSLLGLCCTGFGIYFASINYFRIAMICILWSIFFDWLDGITARNISNRQDYEKYFGKQLDSIIDMVSFGVFPAVFILSYGEYKPIFLIVALVLLITAAIRLSYYNTFGLDDPNHYSGLSLDNNMLLFSILFIWEVFFDKKTFSIVICVVFLFLVILNIAPIRTKKLSGRWFYALIVYNVILSSILFFQYYLIRINYFA